MLSLTINPSETFTKLQTKIWRVGGVFWQIMWPEDPPRHAPKHLTPFSQRHERKKKKEEEKKCFSLFVHHPAENNTYKNLEIG